MVTKELYEAIDQIFRIYSTMSSRRGKSNVSTLTYYASPNPSISGISPTILNLKRDLERLYKPSKLVLPSKTTMTAKDMEDSLRRYKNLSNRI